MPQRRQLIMLKLFSIIVPLALNVPDKVLADSNPCIGKSTPLEVGDFATTSDVPVRVWTEGQGLRAGGDFDGDGELDLALFCESVDGGVVLTAAFGPFYEPHRVIIQTFHDRDAVSKLVLFPAAPGRYRFACAKGYGRPCEDGKSESVAVTNDALTLGAYESGEELLYWTRDGFDRVWLSD